MSSSGFDIEELDSKNTASAEVVPSVGPDGLPIQVIQQPEPEIKDEELIDGDDQGKPARVRRFATIMNLLNSVLGIGILSVPNSLINTGVIPAVVILVLIATLSFVATKIVIKLQLELNSEGFDDLAYKLLGKTGSIILSTLSLLFLVVGLLSFLIIAGDMVMSWLRLAGVDITGLTKRAIVICVYAFLIPIALTIPRSVGFLSYFSTATFISVMFYVGVMIYKGFTMLPSQGIHKTAVMSKIDVSMFQTLAIFGLTFSLPVVVLPVVRPYNPLLHKRSVVSVVAIIACVLLVGISGVIGYLLFGSTSNANIINSFQNNDILFIIVRIGFFIVVSCAYPIVSQSVMCSWSQLFFGTNTASTLPSSRRTVVLIATNGIPLLIAIFLSSAKPALSVGGALGGCIVNFLFPALLWLSHYDAPISSPQKILVIFLAVFGLVAGIISTYQAVIDAIASFK